MNLKITTLIEDNSSADIKLYNEHGLSLYMEIDGMKILFDTGKSGDFIKNAETLNIDLNKLDYVMMSHGHYDHSGGFRKLVEETSNSYKLIVGEDFFNEKYGTIEGDNYKYLGNSFEKGYIHKNNIAIKYIKQDIFYITENIMVFANFKRNNDFELPNKRFQIKQDEKYILDDFYDEIVLVLKGKRGLFVVVGCSHVGIVNILETIIERTGLPIYGIIGGTHLVEADEQRLNKTIDFLKEKDIKIIGVSHCTGEKAAEEIKRQFGERFLYNNTGNIIESTVY
ncbi:MBL fold metallo-hydrolase [Clostridium sp.]|uniref:MBL fold metallo-hydrolase n=1 Tax=Clostridium sp. TaxID=1506 RepID=UPI001A522E56|nr:MBL fold metallo-hydrolase [Clostridium sp.]MBK5241202.1 MBL fold metallo-hydrolase [Clostridium sp.]